MSGDSVTFLSLAYLAEVSIVLNLAYRELKFPELDKKIHDATDEIIREVDEEAQQKNMVLEQYKEYQELRALLSGKGTEDGELFEGKSVLRLFFVYLVSKNRGLHVVNGLLLFSVFYIMFASAVVPLGVPGDVYLLGGNYWSDIWIIAFALLTICCLIPLFFIRGSTLCEYWLFGKPPQYTKKGKLYKLQDILLLRIEASLQSGDNQAKNFAAPPPNT